jgi:dTDP-4-dehydrorhamnose reductase
MTLKNKILVLGSTGMLGHQVVNYLTRFDYFIVYDFSYRKKLRKKTIIIDAMVGAPLEEAIVKIKPDFIINCIGVLIKGSHDIERAIYLNAYLPNQLKKIAENINSKLIQISTDCVFSGSKGQYIETDLRDGQGVYSKTKILGEIIDDTHLTLRTSIIGPELKKNGEGLFHWFMNQAGDISGYKRVFWSGVTTIELARVIKWSIINNLSGLHHITNNKLINKSDLLQLFKKYTIKNININPVDGKNVNKSLIDTRKKIKYQIPSYDVMVKEMIENVKSNISLYQYNELKP